ncbi:hypothetical protein WISP_17035 [Willisornis vidua]|uniref:PiggyBac transposable element-derived protein domain-containing protein n=1 Tax=Willisornis vidua TaxID=1566151 RepID=A0ABQ9DQ61_9PASS|nr:hypothetical protein WISP_17035 [Willisornis vidua]
MPSRDFGAEEEEFGCRGSRRHQSHHPLMVPLEPIIVAGQACSRKAVVVTDLKNLGLLKTGRTCHQKSSKATFKATEISGVVFNECQQRKKEVGQVQDIPVKYNKTNGTCAWMTPDYDKNKVVGYYKNKLTGVRNEKFVTVVIIYIAESKEQHYD